MQFRAAFGTESRRSRCSSAGSAIAGSFLPAMLRAEYISTILPRAKTMV